jgi:hypothetical protein
VFLFQVDRLGSKQARDKVIWWVMMMLIEPEAMGRIFGNIVIADCSKCVLFLLSLAMACMLSAACQSLDTWNGSRLARLIYRLYLLEMRVLSLGE